MVPLSVNVELMIEFAPFAFGRVFVVRLVLVVLPPPPALHPVVVAPPFASVQRVAAKPETVPASMTLVSPDPWTEAATSCRLALVATATALSGTTAPWTPITVVAPPVAVEVASPVKAVNVPEPPPTACQFPSRSPTAPRWSHSA